MSFFPSDWEDEEEDAFQGNIEELVSEFEQKSRDDFSPRELLEIFRFYSFTTTKPREEKGKSLIKTVLEQGVTQFPYMPVFAIHMAEMLMREKNYRLARKYIAQAREYNAFEPSLFFVESVIVSLEGKKDKAIELMNYGLELASNDEETLEDFLELLIFYEQFEMALPILEKSLAKGNDVSYILEKWLGGTTDKQLILKLLPLLDMLVDQDPYSEDGWFLLGSAYSDIENHEKAAWAYDYAATINENFLEAWVGYLESIYELEQYADFIKHYTEQSERFGVNAFAELKGLLAWSQYEAGNTQESRRIYREVLKENPTDSESWYSMGLTWHYESNFAAALPYLERAWELNATEGDYGIVLAAAYFGVREQEKWEAIYDVISKEHGDNEEVWLDWGLALHESGDTNKSIEITQEGLKQNPNSYLLMYRLSALCYLTGQQHASEFLLENALNVNAEEHAQMFIFAPELKKAGSLLRIIARFINPGL